MGSIRQEVKVPTTPETVWDTFADLRRLPEWLTLHVKFKGDVPAPEDYRMGLQVTQVISLLGMPNTITWTVEQYTPMRSVTLTGTGMVGGAAPVVAGDDHLRRYHRDPAQRHRRAHARPTCDPAPGK